MSNEDQILSLLIDPKTGLGALVTGQKALHDRLDAFIDHCKATHAELNATRASGALMTTATEAAVELRVTALENAKLTANGVRQGRLEVCLVVAKIAALFGVSGGGVAALIAILKVVLGGQ